MKKKQRYIIAIVVCAILVIAYIAYSFFASFSASDEKQSIYIDNDDNIDSVYTKLQPIARTMSLTVFSTMARHTEYADHIKTGHYEIPPGMGSLQVFRMLRGGVQVPVMVTVPNVRTMSQMAERLSKALMCDSLELAEAFSDDAVCRTYGFTKATIPSMFVPNSYSMYWNISVKKLLQRMKQEYDVFWNTSRKAKAASMKLTPDQVCTIASIVDEETNKVDEKPKIAGLYYNRYLKGMKLQADPTVKFAIQDFGIRRILNSMLTTDSPYNTYMYGGLPPGPIRVPSQEGIDAVLNYEHHDYLYMCAKEDFSGYHNFAVTGTEHQTNARRYAQALNARGIR